jgi:hypothetical protein
MVVIIGIDDFHKKKWESPNTGQKNGEKQAALHVEELVWTHEEEIIKSESSMWWISI